MQIVPSLVLACAVLGAPAAAQCPLERIVAPDAAPGALFGWSLDVAGDVLAIGAIRGDAGVASAGAVHVLERSDERWTRAALLAAPNAAASDGFGGAVALDGERLVVGAHLRDSGSGAAFVFERAEGAWLLADELATDEPVGGAFFGSAVAAANGVVVVGAKLHDGAGKDAGRVYSFTADGTGGWTEDGAVRGHDTVAGDELGHAVLLVGDGPDQLVVGAPRAEGVGAVYVFARRDGAWVESIRLVPTEAAEGAGFGSALAVVGDLLAIGAPGDGAGAVHLFDRADWTPAGRLVAPRGQAGDGLGGALATSCGALVVGAAGEDTAARDAGAVHVFEPGPRGWSRTSHVVATPGAVGFGLALAADADELFVGAPNDVEYGLRAGAVQPYALAGDRALFACPDSISIAAGGAQELFLDVGPGHAYELYLVLGSLAGTQPGATHGEHVLPLNIDAYLVHTVLDPGSPPLENGLGVVPASGEARARFVLPQHLSSSIAGRTVHHAFVTVRADGTIVQVSNAVALELRP